MENQYKEMIMKEFRQHLNYCNDCHNHSNAQEILDCFIQGIEEILPNELLFDEENEIWEIPETHAPPRQGEAETVIHSPVEADSLGRGGESPRRIDLGKMCVNCKLQANCSLYHLMCSKHIYVIVCQYEPKEVP